MVSIWPTARETRHSCPRPKEATTRQVFSTPLGRAGALPASLKRDDDNHAHSSNSMTPGNQQGFKLPPPPLSVFTVVDSSNAPEEASTQKPPLVVNRATAAATTATISRAGVGATRGSLALPR